MTARAAANGRRAHHRCSVLGCPCRMDFSLAEAMLIASSGSATSISFFLVTTNSPPSSKDGPNAPCAQRSVSFVFGQTDLNNLIPACFSNALRMSERRSARNCLKPVLMFVCQTPPVSPTGIK